MLVSNVSSLPSILQTGLAFGFSPLNSSMKPSPFLAPRLSASPGHPAVANASPIECPAGVKLFCAADHRTTGRTSGGFSRCIYRHPFLGNFSTHCNPTQKRQLKNPTERLGGFETHTKKPVEWLVVYPISKVWDVLQMQDWQAINNSV